MSKKNKQQIRAKERIGSGRDIRIGNDPSRHDFDKIAWQIHTLDLDGKWGWKKIGPKKWWSYVVPKLKNLETMTWAEIQEAAGGRKNGNNSHFIEVKDLAKEAQKRLEDLKMDDISSLFSLRLEGTVRIFGIREGRVLKMVWYDENHEVCPSGQKKKRSQL